MQATYIVFAAINEKYQKSMSSQYYIDQSSLKLISCMINYL